jgi:histidine triad (HIT) family protein
MSLDGRYDDANVFAKILRSEIPSVRIHEDDDVLVFMDAFPQAEGHLLVISKKSHARNMLEIEPEVLQRLILAVQRAAKAVRSALKPDGVFVGQFNGRAAGQTVDHLHFHVIPRWENQALKGHGQGGPADAAELKAIAQKISAVY